MVKGLPKAYAGIGSGAVKFAHGAGAGDGQAEMDVLALPRRKPTLLRPRGPRHAQFRDADRQGSLSKRRQRAPVQFRPDDAYSDSESDSDSELDALKTPVSSPMRRPRLKVANFANGSGTSLSGTTVRVDSSDGARTPSLPLARGDRHIAEGTGTEQARLRGLGEAFGLTPPPVVHDYNAAALDYSDVEVGEADVASALMQERAPSPHHSLRRHRTKRDGEGLGRLEPPHRPQGAVPMTPSLVNALKRIAVAQQEAFGPARATSPNGQVNPIPGLPITVMTTAEHARVASPLQSIYLPTPPFPSSVDAHERNPYSSSLSPIEQPAPLGHVVIDVLEGEGDSTARWDEFWREVSAKAGGGQGEHWGSAPDAARVRAPVRS